MLRKESGAQLPSEDKLVQSLKHQMSIMKEEKSEMIGKMTEVQTEL